MAPAPEVDWCCIREARIPGEGLKLIPLRPARASPTDQRGTNPWRGIETRYRHRPTSHGFTYQRGTNPWRGIETILISAIDDYSRWGFGNLHLGNTSKNASVFLRKCVFDAPLAIQAVRVDRGSEFHKDFIKTCQELGKTLSGILQGHQGRMVR